MNSAVARSDLLDARIRECTLSCFVNISFIAAYLDEKIRGGYGRLLTLGAKLHYLENVLRHEETCCLIQ
jgi:hypothetical protein